MGTKKDKRKIALIFVETDEKIITTKSWDPTCVLISDDESVMMAIDAEDLQTGNPDFMLTFDEFDVIYEKIKKKREEMKKETK